ncbi:hypothetical protein INR49_005851, partial [Caranx melampygus]
MDPTLQTEHHCWTFLSQPQDDAVRLHKPHRCNTKRPTTTQPIQGASCRQRAVNAGREREREREREELVQHLWSSGAERM